MGTPPSAATNPPTAAGAPPAPSVPWWAHIGLGFGLVATGIGLLKTGDPDQGQMAIGAGLAFLGVGSGIAAQS
jgi:hypothetical protein